MPKRKFFIVSNSFAAPFFSDTDYSYVAAMNAREALEKFAAKYDHPCGLYCAIAYSSADAYHRNRKPLARWICNHERELRRATRRKGSYSYLGHAPGKFEIDGVLHTVENPKGGRIETVRR